MIKKSLDGGANDFIKSLFKFSIGSWLGSIVSIISIPIVTRLFSPDQFGLFTIYLLALSMLTILITMGLDHSYIRFFNEPIAGTNAKVLFSHCLMMIGMMWLAVTLILMTLAKPVSMQLFGEVNIPSMLCLSLAVIATVIIRFLNLTYRMRLDARNYTIQAILLALVSKAVFIIAAFWQATYSSAIIVSSISALLLTIIYLLRQKEVTNWASFRFSRTLVRGLFRYGLPMLPEGIMAWFNVYVSSIIILRNLGAHEVGVFSIALSLAAILNLIQLGFSNFWSGYYLQNYKTEQQRICKIHPYITFVMIGLGLGIVLCQDIIFFILGEKYRVASLFFPFLLWAPVTFTISETTSIGISISKKSYLHILSTAAAMITSTILGLIFVNLWGVVGVSISCGIGGIVLFIVRSLLGQKFYKSIDNIRRTIISIILLVSASFSNLLLQDSVLFRSVITLLCLSILSFMYREELRRLTTLSVDIFLIFTTKIRKRITT